VIVGARSAARASARLFYGSAGGLQNLGAALLRSRQRRLCTLRNHSGRVRQRPLRTQIANAHWIVGRSGHISFVLRRRSDCRPRGWSAAYREKPKRAGLCAVSPFIRRLARPLSERQRDAHCGIAYFVGEHAILDRARQHHTANA